MSNDPDLIRARTESTRAELSEDVRTLTDRADRRRRAVRRRTGRIRARLSRIGDRLAATAQRARSRRGRHEPRR